MSTIEFHGNNVSRKLGVHKRAADSRHRIRGGTPDREFRAFDARTGDQWTFPEPAGVSGVPTSFDVDGEQHIAVTPGWDLMPKASKMG
jgi:hypothetical protein